MLLITHEMNGLVRERIMIASYRWIPFVDHSIFEQTALVFERNVSTGIGQILAENIARLGVSPHFVRKLLALILNAPRQKMD